jgi:hypothetical protein
MTEETVTVRLRPEGALVSAVFLLRNTGNGVDLQMGFPDVSLESLSEAGALPGNPGASRIRAFQAAVDGVKQETKYREGIDSGSLADRERFGKRLEELRKLRLRMQEARAGLARAKAAGNRAAADAGAKDLEWLEEERQRAAYLGWFVWPVGFDAGKTRSVEVSYEVPLLEEARRGAGREKSFEYVLRTGAAWKGPIGKARILVRFEGGLAIADLARHAPSGGRLSENGVDWELTDIEPQEDVRIVLDPGRSRDKNRRG